MFIGEYSHTIDAKKRLAIPAKMRRELGEKAVITRGLDSCLTIYSKDAWEKVVEKLSQLSVGKQETRSFIRLILSGAQEVELDALGRVLVPDYLKEYAELKRQVVIAGVYDRIEIWDAEKWQQYKIAVEKNTDAIAQKLGDLGVY